MSEDQAGGHGLKRFIPILTWLPNYQRSWLKSDLIAGLSVWALMVPTSMGYATISGVPVQYGLYAAAVGLIAFALFTTSRQVTQGPSSSTAAVLGAAVLGVAAAGSDEAIAMASAIVLVAGLLFVVMYLLKMGWISEFLSASVLTGFTFGVAINVAAGELFKITGTESSGGRTPGRSCGLARPALPDNQRAHPGGWPRGAHPGVRDQAPLAPRVPGALVAVALGIAATSLLGLADMDVELIADVPRGLPSLALPRPELHRRQPGDDHGRRGGAAARSASRSPPPPCASTPTSTTTGSTSTRSCWPRVCPISPRASCRGCSTTAACPRARSTTTPVPKSQLSNLAQAAFIMLTLLFLAPLFSALPEAVLGAIIIEAVVMGMMDVGEMRRLFRGEARTSSWRALAALLGVMTFGIIAGRRHRCGLSLDLAGGRLGTALHPRAGTEARDAAFVDLREHPDGQTFAGLSILRFDGGLFFVNADALGDRLRRYRGSAWRAAPTV